MSERFTKIFGIDETLHAEGAPLVIRAGALLKDTTTGKLLAQLKLQNVTGEPIIYAKVAITPLDTLKMPLGDAIFYEYLDLQIGTLDFFGSKKAIAIPNPSTRAFSINVLSVGFADGTRWESDGTAYEVISPDSPLALRLAAEQTYCEMLPLIKSQNIEDVMRAKEMLASILPIKDVTLELEQCDASIAALNVQAEQAQKKKKKVKIAILISSIALGLFLIVMAIITYINTEWIPAKDLEKADQLWDSGQYTEAFDAYYDSYFNDSDSHVSSLFLLSRVKSSLEDLIGKGDVEAAFRFLLHVEETGFWLDPLFDDSSNSSLVIGIGDDSLEPFRRSLLTVLNSSEFFRFQEYESDSEYYKLEHQMSLLMACLPNNPDRLELTFEHWSAIVALCLKCKETYDSDVLTTADLKTYIDEMLNCYIWKGDLVGLFEYCDKNEEFMYKVLDLADTREDAWQSIDQARLWDGISKILHSDEKFVEPHSYGAIHQWKMQVMWQAFRHITRSFDDGASLALKNLFASSQMSSFQFKLFNNREYIDQLWKYKVMRDIFLNGENIIFYILDGAWYAVKDDGELNTKVKLEFYDVTQTSASVSWEGLSTPQSNVFMSFNIYDCVLSFYDSTTNEWIADVFRFEFKGSDTSELRLYCYESGETIIMR